MLLPSRLVLSDDSGGLLSYRHRSGIMDTPHSLESRDLGTPGTRVLSIILAMKEAIGSLELGWIPLLLAAVVAGYLSLRLLFHTSRKSLGRILGGSGLLMSPVVDGGREPPSEAPNESELAEVMFACLRLLEYKAATRARELQQAFAESTRRIAVLEDRLIALEEALGDTGSQDRRKSADTTPVAQETLRRSFTLELRTPTASATNLMALSFGARGWDDCFDLGSPRTPRLPMLFPGRRQSGYDRLRSSISDQSAQGLTTTMSAMSLSDFVLNLRADLNDSTPSPAPSYLPSPRKSSLPAWQELAKELSIQIGLTLDASRTNSPTPSVPSQVTGHTVASQEGTGADAAVYAQIQTAPSAIPSPHVSRQ
ncbi:hypothetical protein BKA70DRAFT_862063 [Coprinopsis sp. MPI-PUGE-AT-0042]|nr:hypothetical protein BKA70DRAFT_862063 [Coprinopsis sp. MPI-PUGE-AT-0042]